MCSATQWGEASRRILSHASATQAIQNIDPGPAANVPRDFRRMQRACRLLPCADFDPGSHHAPCSPCVCPARHAGDGTRRHGRRTDHIDAGDGGSGLDRAAGRQRLVALGRQGRAVPAQAQWRDDPRHLAGRDRRRHAGAPGRQRTRRPRHRRCTARRIRHAQRVRAQWRRVRARPAQRRTGPAHPQRWRCRPPAVEPRRCTDLAQRCGLAALGRSRHHPGRRAEGRGRTDHRAQAR